jgi:hypothetical protein
MIIPKPQQKKLNKIALLSFCISFCWKNVNFFVHHNEKAGIVVRALPEPFVFQCWFMQSANIMPEKQALTIFSKFSNIRYLQTTENY